MNKLNYIGGGGYAAPTLEVLDMVVEQGFAASPTAISSDPNDWNEGENDWFKQ